LARSAALAQNKKPSNLSTLREPRIKKALRPGGGSGDPFIAD